MQNGTPQIYGNGTLAGYSTGDATKGVDRVLLLDDATTTIRQQIDRLRDQIGFVRNLADGVFGPTPPRESATNKIAGNPAFRADGLRSSTSELYATISELGEELDRLRAL